MDLNDTMKLLGSLVLLVSYIIMYRRMWCGVNALMEEAVNAAVVGDTEGTLRCVDRLMKGWQKKPEKWFSPMSVASRLVVMACVGENPETAQAVLDHLGLVRGELMWEEEGKPDIPLLAYVKGDPDYEQVVAFLEADFSR